MKFIERELLAPGVVKKEEASAEHVFDAQAELDKLLKLCSAQAQVQAQAQAQQLQAEAHPTIKKSNTHAHNEYVALPSISPSAFGFAEPTDITNRGEPEGGQENSLHHRYFTSSKAALASMQHYVTLVEEYSNSARSIFETVKDKQHGQTHITPQQALAMDKLRQLNQTMMMICSGIDGSMSLPRITSLMMCMTQHPTCRSAVEDYYAETGEVIQELTSIHKQLEELEAKRDAALARLESKRRVMETESVKAALYANEARVSRGRGSPPAQHKMLHVIMTSLRTQVRQHLLRANHHLCVAENSDRFPRMRVMLGIENISNNDLRGISSVLRNSNGLVEGFMPPNPTVSSVKNIFKNSVNTGGERIHRNIKTLHVDDMGSAIGVESMKAVFGDKLATGFDDDTYQQVLQQLVEKSNAESNKIEVESEEQRMERIRTKLEEEKESTKKQVSFVMLHENLHVVAEDGPVIRSVSPFAKQAKRSSLAKKSLDVVAKVDVSSSKPATLEDKKKRRVFELHDAETDGQTDGMMQGKQGQGQGRSTRTSQKAQEGALMLPTAKKRSREQDMQIEMEQVELDSLPFGLDELLRGTKQYKQEQQKEQGDDCLTTMMNSSAQDAAPLAFKIGNFEDSDAPLGDADLAIDV